MCVDSMKMCEGFANDFHSKNKKKNILYSLKRKTDVLGIGDQDGFCSDSFSACGKKEEAPRATRVVPSPEG